MKSLGTRFRAWWVAWWAEQITPGVQAHRHLVEVARGEPSDRRNLARLLLAVCVAAGLASGLVTAAVILIASAK